MNSILSRIRRSKARRRAIPATALLSSIFLLVSACSSGGTAASSNAKKTVNFVNTASIVQPGSVAETNGFFSQAGLNVEFKTLATGTEGISAMLGGSADFVLGGDTRLVAAADKGLPVVAVGLAVTGYPSYLVVPASDTQTKSIADLQGKKIAVEVGSSQHAGFIRYLQALGLSPDSFKFVNLKNAAQPAALASNSVDAAVFVDPFVHGVVDKGIGRIVTTPEEISAKGGSKWPFMLITTKKYIENNKSTVQKFVDAWTCAKEYLVNNPKQALQLTTKALSDYDPKVVPYILKVFSFKTQRIDDSLQSDIKKQGQALVDLGVIKKVPDLTGYFDNSFVDNAVKSGCKKPPANGSG